MKDIRVDGRLQRVFVLKENDDALVYIPLTSLFRIDYERLLDIEAQGGEMLKVMQRTVLDNGINALAQYDKVIQVMKYGSSKKEGTRRRKPDEELLNADAAEAVVKAEQAEQAKSREAEAELKSPEPEKPARRKPGPKPGTKRRKPTSEE